MLTSQWARSVCAGANHSVPLPGSCATQSQQSDLNSGRATAQRRASANATQLPLGDYGSWLMIDETFIFFISDFCHISLQEYIIYQGKIHGKTTIARIWDAPVLFDQLCVVEPSVCLSPCGRSSSSRRGKRRRLDVGGGGSLSCSEPGVSFPVPNSPMSPDRMMIIGLLLHVFSHGKQRYFHSDQRLRASLSLNLT